MASVAKTFLNGRSVLVTSHASIAPMAMAIREIPSAVVRELLRG